MTAQAPKTMFLAQNWHVQAIFGQKMAFFSGGTALKHPFSGFPTLQQGFS